MSPTSGLLDNHRIALEARFPLYVAARLTQNSLGKTRRGSRDTVSSRVTEIRDLPVRTEILEAHAVS